MNLGCLDKLLAKKFSREMPSEQGRVRLKEKQSGYHFYLSGLPANSLVIKCPDNQGWSFEESISGFTQICDYLIFIPKGDGVVSVIFCELKKTIKNNEQKWQKQQIKSTLPLLDYMLSAVRVHFNEKWSVEKYGVVLGQYESDIDIPKDPTFPGGDVVSFTTDNIKVIIGAEHIPVEKLFNGKL